MMHAVIQSRFYEFLARCNARAFVLVSSKAWRLTVNVNIPRDALPTSQNISCERALEGQGLITKLTQVNFLPSLLFSGCPLSEYSFRLPTNRILRGSLRIHNIVYGEITLLVIIRKWVHRTLENLPELVKSHITLSGSGSTLTAYLLQVLPHGVSILSKSA